MIRAPRPTSAGSADTTAAPPGVRFRSDSGLAGAALERLREGPQPASRLVRQVLGLRNASPQLAGRLMEALLGQEPRATVGPGAVWRLREKGSLDRRRLDELLFAVVDVETTGVAPARGGRVVEIGIVGMRGGEIVEEFSSLVNPGVEIPPWISRLTGIDTGMVADAPRFEEISEQVRGRLEGKIFVAHNASYDWGFVAAEMRRARSLLASGPRLCTIALARRALPGLRRRGLDSLAEHLGIEIAGRHRAGGDALATALVLVRLLEEAERRGVARWGQLQGWLIGRRPGGG
ncbi:MAG: PolC-type DNA polymerase III [Gemmatimonadota bacterium]